MTDAPQPANNNDPTCVVRGETLQDEHSRLTSAAMGVISGIPDEFGGEEFSQIANMHGASRNSVAADALKLFMRTLTIFPGGLGVSKLSLTHAMRYGDAWYDVDSIPSCMKEAWQALHEMDKSGQSANFPQLTSWLRNVLPPEEVLIEVLDAQGRRGWQQVEEMSEEDFKQDWSPKPIPNATHPNALLYNKLVKGGELHGLFEELKRECEKEESYAKVEAQREQNSAAFLENLKSMGHQEAHEKHPIVPENLAEAIDFSPHPKLFALARMLDLQSAVCSIPAYQFTPEFFATLPKGHSAEYARRRGEEQKVLGDVKLSPHRLKYSNLIKAAEEYLAQMYGEGQGQSRA